MMVIFGLLLKMLLEAGLTLTAELSDDDDDTDSFENGFFLVCAANKLFSELIPEVSLGWLASSGSDVRCFSG